MWEPQGTRKRTDLGLISHPKSGQVCRAISWNYMSKRGVNPLPWEDKCSEFCKLNAHRWNLIGNFEMWRLKITRRRQCLISCWMMIQDKPRERDLLPDKPVNSADGRYPPGGRGGRVGVSGLSWCSQLLTGIDETCILQVCSYTVGPRESHLLGRQPYQESTIFQPSHLSIRDDEMVFERNLCIEGDQYSCRDSPICQSIRV